MGLPQAEIDGCREAFSKFDRDGSGTIDATELKATLQALGQNPTEEEVFLMIAEVDDDNSGEIEFAEFLRVIETEVRILREENKIENNTSCPYRVLQNNSSKPCLDQVAALNDQEKTNFENFCKF